MTEVNSTYRQRDDYAGQGMSADRKREILRRRARELARLPVAEESGTDRLELVQFRLAAETYGIESRHVREIVPLRDYTPLPCTPNFVMGIVNIRGQILSLLDLGRLFDLPAAAMTSESRVMVLSDGDMEFGILAEVLLGVTSVAPEAVRETLPTLAGSRSTYLRGITDERLIILDAARLLNDPALIVHDEIKD